MGKMLNVMCNIILTTTHHYNQLLLPGSKRHVFKKSCEQPVIIYTYPHSLIQQWQLKS